MSVTLNGTSGLVFGDGTIQGTAAGMPFRNRIINGDMRIDQRNNGAVFTSTSSAPYTVDRWQSNCASGATFTTQRVDDAPAGSGLFNSLKVTVTSSKASVLTSDEYMFRQNVEGYNLADFELGTTSAKTFTVSFWVKSSVTGTHSGAFRNALANRGYAFTYTITSANTWEYKTITVPGDTTGTWNKAESVGIRLQFDLGCGDSMRNTAGSWVGGVSVVGATGAVRLITNSNATWQITGVQLEKAAAATDFEFRPIQTELAMCQRYLPCTGSSNGGVYMGQAFSTTQAVTAINLPVPARVAPSGIIANGTFSLLSAAGGALNITSLVYSRSGQQSIGLNATVASGLIGGNGTWFICDNGYILFTGCEL